MPEQGRNRKDHILPQGYLDGFTGPDGFLHVYDISAPKWSFRSKTENVACERAFYDYSKGVNPDQTADQAFQEYEDYFPNLRAGDGRHKLFRLEEAPSVSVPLHQSVAYAPAYSASTSFKASNRSRRWWLERSSSTPKPVKLALS
jgi:hypothetical protein